MTEKPVQGSYDHELSLGELFNQTFLVARRNYVRVLPVFIAFGIISTLISTYISLATPSPVIPTNLQNVTSTELFSLVNSYVKLIGYTLANYFVTWCILYFAAGIGLWQMGRAFLPSEIVQNKLNYGALAITAFLSVLIIEAGLLLLAVGALVLGTMLYLSLAASVIEGKTPLAALARSRQLVSGRWFRTFVLLAGVQIFVALAAAVISGIVGLPFPAGQESTIAGALSQSFVTTLGFPLVSASMLVLYESNKSGQERIVSRPSSPYDNMKPEPLAAPVQTRMFCTKCGVQVSSEEKFCHNCGALQLS